MVARNEADWEVRLWYLTHDLVVQMAQDNADAGVEPADTAMDCLRLASATVLTYRAAVERHIKEENSRGNAH